MKANNKRIGIALLAFVIMLLALISFMFPVFVVETDIDESYPQRNDGHTITTSWMPGEKQIEKDASEGPFTVHIPYDSSSTGNATYEFNDAGNHSGMFLSLIAVIAGTLAMVILVGSRFNKMTRILSLFLAFLVIASMFGLLFSLNLAIHNELDTDDFTASGLAGSKDPTDDENNPYLRQSNYEEMRWYPGPILSIYIVLVGLSIALSFHILRYSEDLDAKGSDIRPKDMRTTAVLLIVIIFLAMTFLTPIWTLSREKDEIDYRKGMVTGTTEEEFSWNLGSAMKESSNENELGPKDLPVEYDIDHPLLTDTDSWRQNYEKEREVMNGAEQLATIAIATLVALLIAHLLISRSERYKPMFPILLIAAICVTTLLPVYFLMGFPEAMEYDANVPFYQRQESISPEEPLVAVHGFTGSYDVEGSYGSEMRYEWGPNIGWYLWIISCCVLWGLALSHLSRSGIKIRHGMLMVTIVLLFLCTGMSSGIEQGEGLCSGPFENTGSRFHYFESHGSFTTDDDGDRFNYVDVDRKYDVNSYTMFELDLFELTEEVMFKNLSTSAFLVDHEADRILFRSTIEDKDVWIHWMSNGTNESIREDVINGMDVEPDDGEVEFESIRWLGEKILVGATISWNRSSRYPSYYFKRTAGWYVYALDGTTTNITHLLGSSNDDTNYTLIDTEYHDGILYHMHAINGTPATLQLGSYDLSTGENKTLFTGHGEVDYWQYTDHWRFGLQIDGDYAAWYTYINGGSRGLDLQYLNLSSGEVFHPDRVFYPDHGPYKMFLLKDGLMISKWADDGMFRDSQNGIAIVDLLTNRTYLMPSKLQYPGTNHHESINLLQINNGTLAFLRYQSIRLSDRYFSTWLEASDMDRDGRNRPDLLIWHLDLETDTDNDGTVDWKDDDIDGDGIKNEEDDYPYTISENLEPPEVKEPLIEAGYWTVILASFGSSLVYALIILIRWHRRKVGW